VPRSDDAAGQHTGRQELEPRGEPTGSVPAVEAVAREELAAARTWQADDVLEIRSGGCRRTEGRRVEHAPSERDEEQQRYAASQLEPPRRDVPVRNSVAYRVAEQPERHCGAPRRGRGADGRPARHVQADDHRGVWERATQRESPSSPGDRMRRSSIRLEKRVSATSAS